MNTNGKGEFVNICKHLRGIEEHKIYFLPFLHLIFHPRITIASDLVKIDLGQYCRMFISSMKFVTRTFLLS